jgi:GTP-binding protein EngB required for normal cell division
MNNEIEQYKKIKTDIVNISKAYQESNHIEKFNLHINNKLNNFNPTIMIYGVYNAGKSTLLNAIFGKDEMAKTGDAPETAEVKQYNYNGYTIYDTPGINAPIEHQKITDEHLSKSELIIFVLSNNGSFEEKYIYEKIGEIIKAKKPILIAMNNKSGIDMSSEDATNEITKVNQHLSTICDELGIERAEEKVDIIYVDAKTALIGKLENEKELIDESNINQFEEKIDTLLGESGKNEVSNALNLYVSEYIHNTISIIDSKIDNPEMKKTQELITYLEKFKQRTFVELKEIAMQSAVITTANLLELILSRDKNGIDTMITKTTQEIGTKINQRIKEIQEELKQKVDKFKIEFDQIAIDAPNIDISIEDIEISTIKQSNNKESVAIFTAANVAVQSIPPIIPVLGVPIPAKAIAQAALVIFDVFSRSSEAKENAEAQLDMKRALHLSAKNKSDEFGMNFKNQLLQNVSLNIDNIFGNIINQFTEFSTKLKTTNVQLQEDKKRLLIILDKL